MGTWTVRNGKLFFVYPPVREGKKEVLGTPLLILTPRGGHHSIVAKSGQNQIELPVIESVPSRTEERGNYLFHYHAFTVELEGERVTVELTRSHSLTPEAQARQDARNAEQRAASEAYRARLADEAAVRKAEEEEALPLMRALLANPKVIRERIAKPMRLSHHNKLWAREDRWQAYVRHLLATTIAIRTEHTAVGPDDLSLEEIEQARLRIWEACEEIREAQAAGWLAANHSD